ncbi:nucleoside hydrolase [Halosimplex sp. J119]
MTTPLLIDTDPGCDDAIAILLALEHSELEVVGLSTVFGNAPTDATTRNARSVLELFDRTEVPVAAGADEPLLVPLDTAEHIHGPGGIRGDVPEPTEATAPVDAHAAQFIVDQARHHEGELTLAAVGRLTNVALALALEPDLPDLLDEMVIMGGSAFVGGNVTPLASANFYGDPHAARRVVRDTEPAIVPLDATRYSTLPADWIESLSRGDPRSDAVYEWTTYYSEDDLDRYGIETAAIHDALAIAGLVDEDVLDFDPHYVEVGADDGLAQGALACDIQETTGNDPNASVALDADGDLYRDIVTATLDRVLP